MRMRRCAAVTAHVRLRRSTIFRRRGNAGPVSIVAGQRGRLPSRPRTACWRSGYARAGKLFLAAPPARRNSIRCWTWRRHPRRRASRRSTYPACSAPTRCRTRRHAAAPTEATELAQATDQGVGGGRPRHSSKMAARWPRYHVPLGTGGALACGISAGGHTATRGARLPRCLIPWRSTLLPGGDMYSNMGTLEQWWRLGNLMTERRRSRC